MSKEEAIEVLLVVALAALAAVATVPWKLFDSQEPAAHKAIQSKTLPAQAK